MYKLHYDNFLINEHDDEHLLIRRTFGRQKLCSSLKWSGFCGTGCQVATVDVETQLQCLQWKVRGEGTVRQLWASKQVVLSQFKTFLA